MSDLYDALGIPRDADRETVRKAYRKQAKKAHPDAGGTVEHFALVKVAHDTLTDDERRAHYDKTGQFSEKEPDNSNSEVMNLISRSIDMALTAAHEKGTLDVVFSSDLVALIKSKVSDLVKKSHSDESDMLKAIKINQRLLSRFRRKHKDDGQNMMDLLVSGRIRTFQNGIANQQKQRKIAMRALEVLGEYEFEKEILSQDDSRQVGLNILMTAIQNMR